MKWCHRLTSRISVSFVILITESRGTFTLRSWDPWHECRMMSCSSNIASLLKAGQHSSKTPPTAWSECQNRDTRHIIKTVVRTFPNYQAIVAKSNCTSEKQQCLKQMLQNLKHCKGNIRIYSFSLSLHVGNLPSRSGLFLRPVSKAFSQKTKIFQQINHLRPRVWWTHWIEVRMRDQEQGWH